MCRRRRRCLFHVIIFQFFITEHFNFCWLKSIAVGHRANWKILSCRKACAQEFIIWTRAYGEFSFVGRIGGENKINFAALRNFPFSKIRISLRLNYITKRNLPRTINVVTIRMGDWSQLHPQQIISFPFCTICSELCRPFAIAIARSIRTIFIRNTFFVGGGRDAHAASAHDKHWTAVCRSGSLFSNSLFCVLERRHRIKSVVVVVIVSYLRFEIFETARVRVFFHDKRTMPAKINNIN